MTNPRVSVVRTPRNPQFMEVNAAVRGAIEQAGGLGHAVFPGALVIVKPNLVAVPSEGRAGACTTWEVCRAVADSIRELGGSPVIAESSAAGVDTDQVIEALGYAELREQGYAVVNLKKDKTARLSIPGGRVLRSVTTYQLVSRADAIISVPVMKTHDQTEVTLSLKNLKGLIADTEKKRMHRLGVMHGVVDLASAFRPCFAVVDAIVAQEGLGPVYGRPVEMNLVIAGRDLVAVDYVAARIMGFGPDEVLITRYAAERGLGTMNPAEITIVGEDLSRISRRFMRSWEEKIAGVPEFDLLFEEGACTGCRNTVLSSVIDMKNTGQAGYLAGQTIVAGPLAEIPDVPAHRLVLVGACTASARRRGKFVAGCPPNNVWVVEAVVAGRERVVRQYATENETGGP